MAAIVEASRGWSHAPTRGKQRTRKLPLCKIARNPVCAQKPTGDCAVIGRFCQGSGAGFHMCRLSPGPLTPLRAGLSELTFSTDSRETSQLRASGETQPTKLAAVATSSVKFR